MKLLNTEETYTMLQPFETIEQLNANTSAIRAQYKTQLCGAVREVLDVLHRYASKFYGVCYLSKSKIAEMIGVSKRTVIRACQLLESLGCIVQYETKRVNGDKRQSSNAIVFLTQIEARDAFVQQDVEVSDNVQIKSDVTPDVTPNTLSHNAQKDLINTSDTEACDKKAILKKGLVSKLPQTLQYALAPFFDAEELYELSGIVFKAKASVDRTIAIEDHDNDYYSAILRVVNAYARGQLRNYKAVLYSAVQSVTRGIWMREQSLSMFGF